MSMTVEEAQELKPVLEKRLKKAAKARRPKIESELSMVDAVIAEAERATAEAVVADPVVPDAPAPDPKVEETPATPAKKIGRPRSGKHPDAYYSRPRREQRGRPSRAVVEADLTALGVDIPKDAKYGVLTALLREKRGF